jgi:hypothetical protein
MKGSTRLISEHFKRDGTPKRGFDTYEEARRYLDRGAKIYRCKFCGKLHIGH